MRYQFECGYVCKEDEVFKNNRQSRVICPKDGCRLKAKIVTCKICGISYTSYNLSGKPSNKCEKCRNYYTVEEISKLSGVSEENINMFIKSKKLQLSDNGLINRSKYQRFRKKHSELFNKSITNNQCIRKDCVYRNTCKKNLKRCDEYRMDPNFWMETQISNDNNEYYFHNFFKESSKNNQIIK